MEKSSHKHHRVVEKLVIPFSELPFDGIELSVEEKFTAIERAQDIPHDRPLVEIFSFPIQLKGSLTPVGSKVDVRGDFKTKILETCDRCTSPFEQEIEGSISTFLMPSDQFSEHDKPGGKVIRAKKADDDKGIRHRSRSKAPVLADAEGEHEDINFGAFDGETIDLRGLLREQLILALPLRAICASTCLGLCVRCGENIEKKECRCKAGPLKVGEEREEKPLTALAKALESKLSPPRG